MACLNIVLLLTLLTSAVNGRPKEKTNSLLPPNLSDVYDEPLKKLFHLEGKKDNHLPNEEERFKIFLGILEIAKHGPLSPEDVESGPSTTEVSELETEQAPGMYRG